MMLTKLGFFDFIRASAWQIATTAVFNPHEYTLLRVANDKDRFKAAVLFIRANCTHELFGHTWYQVYYENGYKYWSMGASLDKTILVNRCKIYPERTYDGEVANAYDSTYADPTSLSENKELTEMLKRSIRGGSVLDVGCGTGLYIDLLAPHQSDYVGIDCSRDMLRKHTDKHPTYTRIWSMFADYTRKRRYDAVVALFSGSYFNTTDLKRHLKNDGDLFLMFYGKERFSKVQLGNPNYLAPTYLSLFELEFFFPNCQIFEWKGYYIAATNRK
jgi:hypothetical protein